MSGEEPRIFTAEELAVNEMFGERASELREALETQCPELAINYGVDQAILGFVPTFFHNKDHPDLPDAAGRADIVRSEIERYSSDMDAITRVHDNKGE